MPRTLLCLCLGVSALALLVTPVAVADVPFDKFSSAAPLDGEVFVLVNTNSGRCLTVKDGSKATGADVVQGPAAADAGPAERWKAVNVGGLYKLVNVNSGKVLAVPEGSKVQGKKIVQWDDRNDADLMEQRWQFVKSGNHYTLRSRCSGFLLAVIEGRKEDKASVIQWEPTRTAEQLWYVQWVPGAGN